jgi:hypothetical protein
MELRHEPCGAVVHPELACPECGEWVDARDMSVVGSPRYEAARSA